MAKGQKLSQSGSNHTYTLPLFMAIRRAAPTFIQKPNQKVKKAKIKYQSVFTSALVVPPFLFPSICASSSSLQLSFRSHFLSLRLFQQHTYTYSWNLTTDRNVARARQSVSQPTSQPAIQTACVSNQKQNGRCRKIEKQD